MDMNLMCCATNQKKIMSFARASVNDLMKQFSILVIESNT